MPSKMIRPIYIIFISVLVFHIDFVYSEGKSALLVIDVQKCFIKGGSLAVPNGEDVIPVINDIRRTYTDYFESVYFSLDSHPADHVSFASQHDGKRQFEMLILSYNSRAELCRPSSLKNWETRSVECDVNFKTIEQVLWPDHCVLGTDEVNLAQNLLFDSSLDKFIYKGGNPSVDSYSVFFDNGNLSQTDLHKRLQDEGIQVLFLAGLATDYCVKFSALDAIHLGYEVYVIADATKGVQESSYVKSLKEMQEKGVKVINSPQLRNVLRIYHQDL